jgi:hypothetical protein
MESKREEICEYLSNNPGVGVREAARVLGVDPSTVSRARAGMPSTATPAATPDGIATPAATVLPTPAATPIATLADAVQVVLRAAETGELARDDVAEIAYVRMGLAPGDRLHFESSRSFYVERDGKARRSVKVRADS